MKKLIPIAVILSFAVWSGCSSDDPAPTEPPPPPPPVRVVASTTAGAPTLSSVDEAVWDNVTEFALDVSTSNSPKLPAPHASAVPKTLNLKAIVSGGELYLRIEYADNDLNLLKFPYVLQSGGFLNFVADPTSFEDQLYIMFSGLPNSAYDVWNWRSLETAPAGLAEGYTLINDTVLVRDTGLQVVALPNPVFNAWPKWAHKDSSDFTGQILYTEDTSGFGRYVGDPNWALGDIIPGFYIDTLVGVRMQDPAYAQSRWDIFTVSSFDAVNEKITVVLKRKLNTTYSEDLVMADSVQFRIGLFDNQDNFTLGGSRRGYTDLLWLIL